MGLFTALWMIVLGVLGAANLIIAKKPDARRIIGKISPYQGWIGAISAVWGVIVVIRAILHLDLMKDLFTWWITWLALGVLLFILGLLLGIGTLKSFIKQPTAVEKMDAVVAKMAPYQGTLGLISIGLGLWGVLYNIMYL